MSPQANCKKAWYVSPSFSQRTREATPMIEPREKPFDDPSTRRFACFQAISLLLSRLIPFVVLRIESHMRLVAPLIEFSINGVMIVGCIQAQILRLGNGWLWTSILKSVKSGKQQFAIMTI